MSEECKACNQRSGSGQCGFCGRHFPRGPEPVVTDNHERSYRVDTTRDATPGRKDDSGKPRWSLVPWKGMALVLEVLEGGARKYSPDNWRRVQDKEERYREAFLRHALDFAKGEWSDKESHLPHLAHAVCNALFLLELSWEKAQEETDEGEG
jgi:hypothetical protein